VAACWRVGLRLQWMPLGTRRLVLRCQAHTQSPIYPLTLTFLLTLLLYSPHMRCLLRSLISTRSIAYM